jgi:cyclase
MSGGRDRKLQSVGNGIYAYTQLPGSWGWSNAGLICDGEQSLLVDTLFDKRLTADMLNAMRDAAPAADCIDTVVNTHGNGDHCYGNALVANSEIIGTRGCLEDLAASPPKRNAVLMKAGAVVQRLGGAGRLMGKALSAAGFDMVTWLVDAAPFAQSLFGEFDFSNNEVVLPNRTFTDKLTLKVGDKRVDIVEVGPAHTNGDAYVYVPDDRVVFTGDLLFKDAHPIVWAGPVSNWIRACDELLALELDVVVPGHGPITDKSGIEQTKRYLEALTEEARKRYDAGMGVEEAAVDIHLDDCEGWLDAERLYVNVRTLYRDFAGDRNEPHVLELFAAMARFKQRQR